MGGAPERFGHCSHPTQPKVEQVKVCLVLSVLWAAAVPAFGQTDLDINGKRTSYGFAVSDGDTVKFGK